MIVLKWSSIGLVNVLIFTSVIGISRSPPSFFSRSATAPRSSSPTLLAVDSGRTCLFSDLPKQFRYRDLVRFLFFFLTVTTGCVCLRARARRKKNTSPNMYIIIKKKRHRQSARPSWEGGWVGGCRTGGVHASVRRIINVSVTWVNKVRNSRPLDEKKNPDRSRENTRARASDGTVYHVGRDVRVCIVVVFYYYYFFLCLF